VIGLFGGTFDPPHNGHLALVEAALVRFGLGRLLVLVLVAPGHRSVELKVEARLRLARLAFGGLPGIEVAPDEHARTVDTLRARRFADPIFLIGADQFANFLSWKAPDGVLELARLGVATRPGYPRELLERVLAELTRPERVEFFEISAVDASSTEVRERVRRGESIDGLVPAAVAREIEIARLYR
jgi:nicotinate-nucleotide adenylyltransferase